MNRVFALLVATMLFGLWLLIFAAIGNDAGAIIAACLTVASVTAASVLAIVEIMSGA